MPNRTAQSVPAACLLLAVVAGVAHAQRTQFEAAWGPWYPSGDSAASVFHAGVMQPVAGLFGFGLSLVHVADGSSAAQRTLTGGELSLRIGGAQSGPYAIGSTGLGLRHADGNPDAFWTVGGGLAFRLLGVASIGAEVRYRVEDTGLAGFWRIAPDDRTGLQAQARLSFRIPQGGPRPATPTTSAPSSPQPIPTSPAPAAGGPPPPSDPYGAAVAAGASEEAARLSATVVETALAAMGSPYSWGGSDANGFDCSGLIQYAYGQVGIVLPRISRDQMRMGRAVDRDPTALRPADILGFSASGTSQITHVGLYVGDGQFIHSSSTGVKLSSLTASDADSRWWRDRWVGVRRIVE
jgi:cell wall-associated NlpC family hydrolase